MWIALALAGGLLADSVPPARYERLSRGLSIEGWWNSSDRSDAHRRGFVTREDLDQIARSGFRHIRIPTEAAGRDLRTQIETALEVGLSVIVAAREPAAVQELTGLDPERVFFEASRAESLRDLRALLPGHTLISLGSLPPEGDRNVVVAWRFDEPTIFTQPPKGFRNVPYPSSPVKLSTLLAQAEDLELRGRLQRYGRERWDSVRLQRSVQAVLEPGKRAKRLQILYVAGVDRELAPRSDRLTYHRDLASALDRENVGWSLGGYDDRFGPFSGSPGSRKRDEDFVAALGVK